MLNSLTKNILLHLRVGGAGWYCLELKLFQSADQEKNLRRDAVKIKQGHTKKTQFRAGIPQVLNRND